MNAYGCCKMKELLSQRPRSQRHLRVLLSGLVGKNNEYHVTLPCLRASEERVQSKNRYIHYV